MPSLRKSAPPTIYEVETIGTGKLSVMAMPNSGEQFAGLRQLGIDHVVSLLDVTEQCEVGLGDEQTLCAKNSMRYTSFPITDRDVPQKADALDLAVTLNRDINNGEHVVIHCRAGVGRAGMIASAVLVQAGYSPGEAIHISPPPESARLTDSSNLTTTDTTVSNRKPLKQGN